MQEKRSPRGTRRTHARTHACTQVKKEDVVFLMEQMEMTVGPTNDPIETPEKPKEPYSYPSNLYKLQELQEPQETLRDALEPQEPREPRNNPN